MFNSKYKIIKTIRKVSNTLNTFCFSDMKYLLTIFKGLYSLEMKKTCSYIGTTRMFVPAQSTDFIVE